MEGVVVLIGPVLCLLVFHGMLLASEFPSEVLQHRRSGEGVGMYAVRPVQYSL
jgi:hypothetical protein